MLWPDGLNTNSGSSQAISWKVFPLDAQGKRLKPVWMGRWTRFGLDRECAQWVVSLLSKKNYEIEVGGDLSALTRDALSFMGARLQPVTLPILVPEKNYRDSTIPGGAFVRLQLVKRISTKKPFFLLFFSTNLFRVPLRFPFGSLWLVSPQLVLSQAAPLWTSGSSTALPAFLAMTQGSYWQVFEVELGNLPVQVTLGSPTKTKISVR